MYQRGRAEKSEVQNLIYGDAAANQKNYMKQNYEELKQKQREAQQKIQQDNIPKEENWKMKKFRDVKSKLVTNGTLNDENVNVAANNTKEQRSRTQDKRRNNDIDTQKNAKVAKPKGKNVPLMEKNINNKPPAPVRRKSALQTAGKDMLNSSKAQNSLKVGAFNPPPLEQPNVVYYTADSKEDIFSLVPQVDPIKAHKEKYIPRNIPVPKAKRPPRPAVEEEVKLPKKEGIPSDKGFIAPKKEKNFIKDNYNDAADEAKAGAKSRAAAPKPEDNSNENKNYGKVPKYLQKYNQEREKEVQRKKQMEEDKDVSFPLSSLGPYWL